MVWRESFLDLILIPLSLLLPMLYHAWLYRAIRRHPLSTAFGVYSASRRVWISGMMKDNDDKKGVLVVQSFRNVIMGSTLMATTAVLFCTGIAAVLSSTYAIKKPLSDAVFGAHGEYMMALKYVALLLLFLFAFLCHSLTICFLTKQASSSTLPRSRATSSRPTSLARSSSVGSRSTSSATGSSTPGCPCCCGSWPAARLPVLPGHDPDTLQPRRRQRFGGGCKGEHSSGCVNASKNAETNGNGCMHV
ncbi:hypothetical protein ACQ4PT_058417 [Festuca glaucescens]